jgi:hypothetical protein
MYKILSGMVDCGGDGHVWHGLGVSYFACPR